MDSKSDEGIELFSIYLIIPAALSPGVHWTLNRNEYQKHKNMFLKSRAQSVHEADSLTIAYDPIV
jgi:hypothetical protein